MRSGQSSLSQPPIRKTRTTSNSLLNGDIPGQRCLWDSSVGNLARAEGTHTESNNDPTMAAKSSRNQDKEAYTMCKMNKHSVIVYRKSLQYNFDTSRAYREKSVGDAKDTNGLTFKVASVSRTSIPFGRHHIRFFTENAALLPLSMSPFGPPKTALDVLYRSTEANDCRFLFLGHQKFPRPSNREPTCLHSQDQMLHFHDRRSILPGFQVTRRTRQVLSTPYKGMLHF